MNLAGIADEPLLIAIILASTSLGVIVPVLQDSGEISSRFGQLVIAAASIADFASVLLLTLLFSGESSGVGAKLILIGLFVLVIAAVTIGVAEAERSRRISAALARLQDTSAQIRVRGAIVLLIGMVALAEQLGLELILGAFAAGAILNHLDTDRDMTHPEFRRQARGGRLWRLHPRLLRRQRDPLRPRGAVRVGDRDRLDPGLRRRPAGRARDPGAALPRPSSTAGG